MAIRWDEESMGTGVPELDGQHRMLIGRLNHLFNRMQGAAGAPELAALLEALSSYAEWHFAQEREWMELLYCPVTASNHAAHEQFLGGVHQLLDHVRAAAVTQALAIDAEAALTRWATGYLARLSRQMRPYVPATADSQPIRRRRRNPQVLVRWLLFTDEARLSGLLRVSRSVTFGSSRLRGNGCGGLGGEIALQLPRANP